MAVPWLDPEVDSFIQAYWNTDVREIGTSESARKDIRWRGKYDEMRSVLLDVILRRSMRPREWSDLCNVQVDTQRDVREDALDFWNWLFDEEPLPARGPPKE